MKRIERIRLYPTARQEHALCFMLDVTRELYNALLQERRDAYRLRGITVTSKMQYAELTALRAQDRRVRSVYRECQDAVLHRLDLAMGGAAYSQNDRLQAGIEGADAVARAFSGRARAAQPVFIDGQPGAVWMHEGEVRVALRFAITDGRITAIDLVADRAALARSVIERNPIS